MDFLKKLSEKQKKWITAGAVSLILVFMFLLAFFSSHGGLFGDPGDSGTVDEIAHIPSGYSYDKYFDYRLNPEHPPLAKALAGLPLTFLNINGPKDDWSWNGINQWEAGWYMIYEAGNNPATIFLWARLPMMLLMIGLGLFLFKWSRELFGRKIGLLTLLMYAFYPDVIAHGRLVTTDIAAAFGYVVAIYYFDKMLKKPNAKTITVASLAFALAQLLKFSAFLLFGGLLILVVARAILERKEGFWKKIWFYFKPYLAVCFLSVLFVWIVYIPFVWKTPVSIEHQLIETNLTSDPRTLPLRNLLHAFEGNAITRGLGHYLLGIMLVVARVEGGNATFLMGQVAEKSIPYFFPVAWLIKTPLSIIILTFWSLAMLFFSRKRSFEDKWALNLILMPIALYWAFTLKGSLNIGIRHLMPTVPFVLLFIAYTLSKMKSAAWKWGTVAVLIVFQIAHTLSYYPSYIGYFNNLVPKDQRYKYLVDSSLDWGQDLLRLKKFVDDNQITSIKLDYFGGGVPSYSVPEATAWHSSYGPTTGWLAVSATFYQSSKLYGEKEGKWSYQWLEDQKPVTIVGGSILVFHITDQDLIDHPARSPYPITTVEYPADKQNSLQTQI